MGWSYIDRMPADVQKFCTDQIEAGGGCKVLQSAMVGSEYYAAVQDRSENVFAAVVLTEGRFGWKMMDESCNPYYWGCPAEILDRLTPTESAYALKWRAKCREQVAA